MKASGHFLNNRKRQNENWLIQYLEQELLSEFYRHPKTMELLPQLKNEVINGNSSPFLAAEKLLKALKSH